MEYWIRFAMRSGETRFGTLRDGQITVHDGDMFTSARPWSGKLSWEEVTLLTPTQPDKMIGLWNNFHERAAKEGLNRPAHPLYFLKAANSFAASGEFILRPPGYDGAVVFEGELGVVIGRRCAGVAESEADENIFGYTCVNDITARHILKSDPSFVQWTRAKSFDTFGMFGPVIARGVDSAKLRVVTLVNGVEKQNYAVSDMFYSPQQLVSLISRDMTLNPGDIIACGTSVGAGALVSGDRVEVMIDGVGTLTNVMR